MQSESPSSSAPRQPMPSGLSIGPSSFSYNSMHSNVGFSSAQMLSTSAQATEQGHSDSAKGVPTSGLPRLPPPPPVSHPGSFVPGVAAQMMAPPGSPFVGSPNVHTGHVGNYSFNGVIQPKLMDQSTRSDARTDGMQELGTHGSSQSVATPSSQSANPNSSSSVAYFATNNFSNSNAWILPVPSFQVPVGMPNNLSTPGPPGIASSMPAPSPVDFASFQRTSNPAAPPPSQSTSQHLAVRPYPIPSPQAVPPGPWLQPQISSLSRPPPPAYSANPPCPYPVPAHGIPTISVSTPDVQPPGVPSPASSVRAPTSSFPSGSQSTIGLLQPELPPGIESSGPRIETQDETSNRKQLDSWTAHRTESGILYYYNVLTGESTYEKPSGFKGESDKAIQQPIPLSWGKMAGTDWIIVTTNDGKRYYYNSTTQVSSWQIPSEVMEFMKKQEAEVLKAQSVSVTNTDTVTEKGSAPASLNTPAANTGGRDATALRHPSVSGSSSALDLIKKKLQDSGIPASTSSGPALSSAMDLEPNGSKLVDTTIKSSENRKEKLKDANGDADVSDSSSDSEDEEKGPSKEECILQFKEMLKERGVVPFSKWEKELPKIVFDPRFKAIPSHSARRALFEHYVRTRAEEERKEKRAAQKAALEGFKQLLEEAKEDIDQNTDYQAFKMKWGDDPRFRAVDRKERESLLNERVFPLKRAAQEQAQADRSAAISDFKSMLQDKGDITSSSRWSKVKDDLKNDPRYKSVKHEEREKLFNEYVAELKAAEEEMKSRAKAKQDEEEKLKERERALRKRKEREEQEVERVRIKARRKESVESYQALLVETIKDPQASWTESKPKLDKDPQGRAANPHLDKSDLEKLFREHVKSLHERCVVEYRALLAEVITAKAAAKETQDGKTVASSWSMAKQLLKSDPRYNKMPRKERESLWRRHADDIQRLQKQGANLVAGKSKSPVDSGKRESGSRRPHDRR